jgi:hypothetical protein
MSRYYDITVTPAPTKANPNPPVFRHWTSMPNGVYDPGALNVEFDFLVYPYATPMGGSSLTIEGVSLQDLLQAQQFAGPPSVVGGVSTPGVNGMSIAIKAGMQAGLPLANPKQSGLILQGYIYQSFGNWRGTDMTLDFVINASPYSFYAPGNIVLNWKAGTPLATALAATLSTAYPGLKQNINISPNLVLAHDDVGHYHTLSQLAAHVKSITAGAISSTYPGVDLSIIGGKIVAYDGTQSPPTVQIQFTDLIGQPTWIDPNVMQLMCVMRADIQIGDFIVMPQGLQDAPGIVQTAASSLPSQLKYKTSFQGKFSVVAVRQVGNFRSTDGAAWSTIIQGAAVVSG